MVEIDVKLTLRSPMNIGAGAQHGTFARRPMLKSLDGWPYVPASTLKGRWRHAVEQVASSLPHHRVCQTHHAMCRTRPCQVCRLFGSPWTAGKVRFQSLHLVGPEAIVALRQEQPWLKTTSRTGVAINRRRGVAQDDFLFDTELFLPGMPLVFQGTVRGDLTQQQAGLLVAGLQLIPALGGSKSSGLGWLETAVTVTANGEAWTPDMLAAAWEEVSDE